MSSPVWKQRRRLQRMAAAVRRLARESWCDVTITATDPDTRRVLFSKTVRRA